MKSSYYMVQASHLVQKYRFFIFIAIFSILPVLLLPGTTISDPKPILSINPMGFAEELYNIWSPHELGFAHGHDVSYLPIALIFSALTPLLSPFVVGRLFFVCIFFVAGSSFFLLALKFSLEKKFAMLGALFFMYNFYPLVFFGDGSSSLVLLYAFCPLFLFLTMKAMNEKKIIYAIVIAGISGLIGGINPTMTAIAFIPVLIYLAINLERGQYFPIKYTVVLLFAMALANLYWIVPGINAIFSSGPGALNLFVEPPAFDNRHTSFAEVTRLLGQWGFYDGWQGAWYYTYAPFYILNPFGVLLSYVIPVMAFAGLIIRRTFDKKLIFLILLLALSIPMAIGAYPVDNPGLNGQAYLWLYNNIPFFEMFRNTYKFVMLTSLAYALLFPSFLQEVSRRLPAILQKVRRLRHLERYATPGLVVALGFALVLITYWPAWTGGIENPNRSFQVPNYYGEAANYFESDPGKVIMLTPYRFGSNYHWGILGGGGEVFEIILQSPIIDENPNTKFLQTPGNLLINLVYSSIYANQTVSIPVLMDYLGVEYLVQQNDIDISTYDSLNSSTMKNILMSTPGLTFQESFGELDVYRHETAHGYVEAYGSARVLDIDNDHSLASYIINTSLLQSKLGNSSWLDYSIRANNITTGDFTIGTISSILEGERTGMLVFFSDRDYVVFSASSPSGNGSGMYHFKDGSLYQEIINQSAIFQPQQSHNLEVSKIDGLYEFTIDGIHIGKYLIGESVDDSYRMGMGTQNTTATYDKMIITSAEEEKTYRFNYSVFSDQKDFEILGGNWSMVASNQTSTTNASTVLISSDQAKIIKNLPQSLYLPEDLTYTYHSPVDITAEVTNSSGPFVLVLKTTVDKWKCTVNGKVLSESNHFIANGYQNAWLINETGDLTITLSYENQADHLAMAISGISIVLFIALTIVMMVTGSTTIIKWKRQQQGLN